MTGVKAGEKRRKNYMKTRILQLIALSALILLLSSMMFVDVSVQQPLDVAYIEPSQVLIGVGETFNVTVFANVTFGINVFDLLLTFDSTQMSFVNVTALTPWEMEGPNLEVGSLRVGGHYPPLVGPGKVPLVETTFHCDAPGISQLQFDHVLVVNGGSTNLTWQGATVLQWYFKASFEDYAPSGVPDFDQRQSNWTNPVTGAWTWCGPVAAANSLWWFDSKYEPNPVPPPTVNDGFPLVSATAYGPWDDHDPQNVEPFVDELAWFMDTDGQRTGLNHSGTNVYSMEAGVSQYLQAMGVNPMGDVNCDGVVNGTDQAIVENALMAKPGDPNWNLAADLNGDNIVNSADLTLVIFNLGKVWGKFLESTVAKPTFEYIAEQVEKSEDVIILLGLWQDQDGVWVRVGGHFVTIPGVSSATNTLAFSDPIRDNAELGFPGRILPPPPHPHNPVPPFPLHNNASYVSHDFYSLGPSPSPGGSWGIEGYDVTEIIENFAGQNVPPEFEESTGPYKPGWPLFAEAEYAVIISPIRDVAITNKTVAKNIVGQGYPVDINLTVANEGGFTETFNVTTYYSATSFSEGFENGTFAGWDFHYSGTDVPYGTKNGTVYYAGNPVAQWNSSIISINATSGLHSARLFADFWQHTYVQGPWQVNAAINQTINRASASKLRATLRFDDIQGSGGVGASYFAITIFNAQDSSKAVSYGFSTTGDFGNIKYTVIKGELLYFERDIEDDYYNKYNATLPDQIIMRFHSFADYAEGIPARRTTDVLVDDISLVLPKIAIETKTVTLANGSSTFLTFTWNTTNVCMGNYTISATADTVPEETDVTDNTLIDGWIFVTIAGDLDTDMDVDIYDVVIISGAYGSTPSDGNWNPNCDLTEDYGKIDIYDVVLLAGNYGYGKSW